MKINIILLSIIALLTECCKTPTDNIPSSQIVICDSTKTVHIPQDMKDRFYFKEGTYWIYKNIATGETDSIWVYKSNNGISPVNRKIHAFGWDKCYEGFFYELYNISFYTQGKYYEQMAISLYPQNGSNLNNELFGIQQLSPLNNYKVSYHIYIEGKTYSNNQGAKINFMDSVVNNENRTYRDILNIYYPNRNTNDIYSDMYYGKNIGLVKFTRSNDNSDWELIRYKINQ